MYNECRHIRPSGHKCRAAALNGKAFCYYHVASRRSATNRVPETGPVQVSSVEDGSGVMIAINQILKEFGKGHIDRHSARTFLYGVQIAASILRNGSPDQRPSDVVREFLEDPVEGIIALEKCTCDPDECPECEKHPTCKDSQYKESIEDFRRLVAEYHKNPDAI